MNTKTYYIFSDERGTWSTLKDIYYVRGWIMINSDDYIRLKTYYENAVKICQIKTQELKWSNRGILLDYYDIATRIFKDSNLKTFLSFSILEEFYKKKIRTRESLFKVLDELDLSYEKLYYLQKLPDKIKGSINYLFFLNIYERYHIWDALESLVSNKVEEKYYTFFDKPQFLEKDFGELAGSVIKEMYPSRNGDFKIRMVNSKDYLGIQIADIVAGCYYSLLTTNLSDGQSLHFFKELIKPQLVQWGNVIPGIKKVMYKKEEDEKKDLIKKIKSKLS